MGAPAYPIDTLAQMAAIPEEARPRFLAEFPAILETAASIARLQEAFGDLASVSMAPGAEWVDDDKGLATVNTVMPDCDGEEIAQSTTTWKHDRAARGAE